MREKKGSFKTIQQSDGNEAHLHRHPDAPQQFDAVSIMAPPGRADPTFLDVVYQALLQFLPISSKSPRRSGLLERGFSEKDILRFGYRDYPEAKPLGFGATS